MLKTYFGFRAVPIAVLMFVASLARAETVSYSATFRTSKGNPVYDILILESDATQQVHATVYPAQLPGVGTSVISHDVPFTPVKTLVIGLTEGKDTDGSDKTQIIMLLDSTFAAAHVGMPFSSIFVGTRHSTTIAALQAAVAGDATQLAWFTDTFFPGPAAGAAFDSFGPFTVAEFTSLTIDGVSAAGNWTLNSAPQIIPFTSMDAIQQRATAVIDETAQTDLGPFDIQLSLTTDHRNGQFALDKTVVNNTGTAWRAFEMTLGTGSGNSFVRSTAGDGTFFVTTPASSELTGAFPTVDMSEDRLVFTGSLPPGGTAHFVVFVGTNIVDEPKVTVRQLALSAATSAAPLLSRWSIVLLAAVLCCCAAFRLRRAGQPA